MATATPMPTKSKSKQLILVVIVLGAGVFIATFMSNYTGSSRQTKGDRPDPKTIREIVIWGPKTAAFTFWPTLWKPWPDQPPEVGNISPEREYCQPGYHDFFFQNPSADPIRVGLHSKSCRCAEVLVASWPEEWKAYPILVIDTATQVAEAWTPLGHLGALGATAEDLAKTPTYAPELAWTKLEQNDSKGAEVPGHAAGWIRIRWDKREDKTTVGPFTLSAQLWSEYKDSGVITKLDVPIVLVEPILTRPEGTIDFGLITGGDVRTKDVLVVSATREDFPLKVEVADDPLVQVSKPVALSEQECRELWFPNGNLPPMGRIVKGYKLTVTIREHADGKQLDLGILTRRLTLHTDPDVEPVHLSISGKVRGGVTVGTPDDHDRVDLGHFPSETGAEGKLPITTELSDVKLSIDKENLPKMLEQTTIEEIKDSIPRTWVLYVRLSPNRWEGILPRDLAVFVKAEGPASRRIRIPVIGDAYHR